MAHGPKSKKKHARVAREIKRFAQKLGLPGRVRLVQKTAHSMTVLAINTWTNIVMAGEATEANRNEMITAIASNTHRILARRKVTRPARKVIVREASLILQKVV